MKMKKGRKVGLMQKGILFRRKLWLRRIFRIRLKERINIWGLEGNLFKGRSVGSWLYSKRLWLGARCKLSRKEQRNCLSIRKQGRKVRS
jgi:hypothetical protein